MKFCSHWVCCGPLNGSQVCSHQHFFFLHKWFALHVGIVYWSHWQQMLHFPFISLSQYSYYEFNAHMSCSCIHYSVQKKQPSPLSDELFFALWCHLHPALLLGHQKLCQLLMIGGLVIDAWKAGIVQVKFAPKELDNRVPMLQSWF